MIDVLTMNPINDVSISFPRSRNNDDKNTQTNSPSPRITPIPSPKNSPPKNRVSRIPPPKSARIIKEQEDHSNKITPEELSKYLMSINTSKLPNLPIPNNPKNRVSAEEALFLSSDKRSVEGSSSLLPKELIKHIMYLSFVINDEIVLLQEDIIDLEKECLFNLIHCCFNPFNNIDILSPEYTKYIDLDINDVQYRIDMINFDEYHSVITSCIEKLYLLDNNIFTILLKRYYNKSNKSQFIENYKRNIKFYANKMKISRKYSSLLTIKIFQK